MGTLSPLAQREDQAWRDYAAACRVCPAHDLDAMEPVFWKRLKLELHSIDQERAKRAAA